MRRWNLKIVLTIIALIIISFLLFKDIEPFFLGVIEHAKESKALFAILSAGLLSWDALLPVPSSVIMFMNGHVLGILGGVLVSMLGGTAGSMVAFYVGYAARSTFGENRAEKMGLEMLNHFGIFAVLISRGIPILSETVIVYMGYKRASIKSVVWLSALGYLPVSLVYAIFGFYSFENSGFFYALTFALLLAIIMSCVVWLASQRYLRFKAFNKIG